MAYDAESLKVDGVAGAVFFLSSANSFCTRSYASAFAFMSLYCCSLIVALPLLIFTSWAVAMQVLTAKMTVSIMVVFFIVAMVVVYLYSFTCTPSRTSFPQMARASISFSPL